MVQVRAVYSVRLACCFVLAFGSISVLGSSSVQSSVTSQVNSNWLEEDEPESKIAKSGIQMTEGNYGIPVSIDNLFEQIQPNPPDDQECTNGSELSEMDMCLTQPQLGLFSATTSPAASPGPPGRRKKRQASANGFSLWENGVIPYIFNSTFPAQDRDAIVNAMSEWEKGSCVRFRPANREDRDLIVFKNGKRCSTNIGRITGEQAVTLAKTCRSKRILIHELGHVIGLIHEHQRHDRDKYVKVMLENVRNMSQERYQFTKLLSGSITDKAVKYDYTSVMHYGKNYFARLPHLITLHTLDQRYQDVIGRAEKPSFSDLETVNRLYLCSAGCPPSLQCGENCYMDKMCMCRCRAGYDKAYFSGPGPYRNNLPDSTCEFFATRGECTGNIKDTVRPLCAKSCGLQRYKFNTPTADTWSRGQSDAVTVSNRNNNLVQQRQQQLRQQLQSSKRGQLRGGGGGGGPMSPTSPSASRVWSRGNSINAINNGLRFNNNNNNDNFINSIYSTNNNLNGLNDIQIIRGDGRVGTGIPRQQQQLRNFQSQTILRDGQILQGSDNRGQQARMAQQQQQQQNFRAAFLQRQAALSSSEPNLLRSLVLGRSSNGRTARLLLPAQVNSRSLQRRLPNGPSSISTQRLNLLRQQEATRLPLLARSRSTLDNLRPQLQGNLARSRLTRTSALRDGFNWIGSDVSSQRREFEINRQRLLASNNRQRARASNVIFTGQNLARLSPTVPSSSVTTTRWRDLPSRRGGRFMLGRVSDAEFPVSGSTLWRKPTSFRSQNVPVALDVERISGPLPLAGFNGLEFSAGGSIGSGAGKPPGSSSGVVIDTVNSGRKTPGEGTLSSDATSQKNVIADQSLTVSSQASDPEKKEHWDPQPPPTITSNLPLGSQTLHSSGGPSYLGFDRSALNSIHTAQEFEPPPPPPPLPPIPPTVSSLDPAIWDSLANSRNSQPTVAGRSEPSSSNAKGISKGNENVGSYVEPLGLTGQLQAIPLEPVNMASTDIITDINGRIGESNGPHYNVWSQSHQEHQHRHLPETQNRYFQQQQLQHIQRQPLFERPNKYQAFTDSEASSALAKPVKHFDAANPTEEPNSNSSLPSAQTLHVSLEATPSLDAKDSLPSLSHAEKLSRGASALTHVLANAQPKIGQLPRSLPLLRYPTGSIPAQEPASVGNDYLGLTSSFFENVDGGANSPGIDFSGYINSRDGGGINNSNNNNNNQNTFKSLLNIGLGS